MRFGGLLAAFVRDKSGGTIIEYVMIGVLASVIVISFVNSYKEVSALEAERLEAERLAATQSARSGAAPQ